MGTCARSHDDDRDMKGKGLCSKQSSATAPCMDLSIAVIYTAVISASGSVVPYGPPRLAPADEDSL